MSGGQKKYFMIFGAQITTKKYLKCSNDYTSSIISQWKILSSCSDYQQGFSRTAFSIKS